MSQCLFHNYSENLSVRKDEENFEKSDSRKTQKRGPFGLFSIQLSDKTQNNQRGLRRHEKIRGKSTIMPKNQTFCVVYKTKKASKTMVHKGGTLRKPLVCFLVR